MLLFCKEQRQRNFLLSGCFKTKLSLLQSSRGAQKHRLVHEVGTNVPRTVQLCLGDGGVQVWMHSGRLGAFM